MFALCITQYHGCTVCQGEHPQILRGVGVQYEKRNFRDHTGVYLFIVVAYISRHFIIVKCRPLARGGSTGSIEHPLSRQQYMYTCILWR